MIPLCRHSDINWAGQAFSKLIVTCSTFALYTTSFTKDANKALLAAETPEGDGGAKKRSDFLIRFETNFNHWLRVRPLPWVP